MPATPQDLLHFWREAGPAKWFAKDARFDEAIRLRFEPVHHSAARGEYAAWAETADGALALLLLLDQFPRNLWRGSAHAFATDPLARAIAHRAVRRGFDQEVDPAMRIFFYLPFEHAEDVQDQALAVELCAALGDAEYLKFAKLHQEIIVRFGRFPHRNACLGRETTPVEQAFLDEGGFAG